MNDNYSQTQQSQANQKALNHLTCVVPDHGGRSGRGHLVLVRGLLLVVLGGKPGQDRVTVEWMLLLLLLLLLLGEVVVLVV